jgi:GGDEF domain-containing protein
MSTTRLPRRFLDSELSRIGAGIAVSAVLLVAVFSVLVFENQLDLIAENAMLRAGRVTMQLQQRVESAAASGAGWDASLGALGAEAEALDLRKLTVFSPTGDVLYSLDPSRKALAPIASLIELKAIHRAFTSRDFQNRSYTHDLDVRRRIIEMHAPFSTLAAGTPAGGAVEAAEGVVAVELGLLGIDQAIERVRRQAFVLAGVVLLLHALLAVGAYVLLVRPLYSIVAATQAVAGGRYDLALPRGATYEMATLVDSFLAMSRSVGEANQSARSANPLTGLPGNVEIERHLLERLKSQSPFAVLYCDLDNFKAYNDCYGFARGDEVILYTRDCLTRAASTVPSDCFVGHQGGDDFVVVCRAEDWEKVASTFVALFDHGIGRFYNETDRARGYILSRDRQDREQNFPLMTVSVAAASNRQRRFESYGEIVAVVSEVKHMVKSKAGSGYAIDRRAE